MLHATITVYCLVDQSVPLTLCIFRVHINLSNNQSINLYTLCIFRVQSIYQTINQSNKQSVSLVSQSVCLTIRYVIFLWYIPKNLNLAYKTDKDFLGLTDRGILSCYGRESKSNLDF